MLLFKEQSFLKVSMSKIIYREATGQDIPFLAKIRSTDSAEESYWNARISGYAEGTHYPQKALKERIIYVATENERIIGFIAGHLTRRYDCDGELQWIDVIESYRRKGIASKLVKLLTEWFVKHDSCKICVDPGNDIARQFYKANGATALNNHWMYWEVRKSGSSE